MGYGSLSSAAPSRFAIVSAVISMVGRLRVAIINVNMRALCRPPRGSLTNVVRNYRRRRSCYLGFLDS